MAELTGGFRNYLSQLFRSPRSQMGLKITPGFFTVNTDGGGGNSRKRGGLHCFLDRDWPDSWAPAGARPRRDPGFPATLPWMW